MNNIMYNVDIVKQSVTAEQVALAAGIPVENHRSCATWRGGDNPTIVSYSDNGMFYDFKTEKGGSCIDLYMLIYNCNDFETAVNELGKMFNLPKEKEPPSKTAAKQNKPSFLTQSTISDEQIKQLAANLEQDIKQGKIKPLPYIDHNGYMETAVYEYRYENGNLAYTKHRKERINADGIREKTFRYCLADGKTWKEPPEDKRLLYNLPNIIKPENQIIYFNEGEKSAEACIRRGWCSTTSGSCNSWQKRFADYLKEKDVIILRDYDDAGLKHALSVALDLLGVAKSVKVLTTYTDKKGGDVADFFDYEIKDASGNAMDEESKKAKLMQMVADAPIVTENDRTRLETQLEEVKKSVNKDNGSLGGRPKNNDHEPDVIAEKFLGEYTDQQGIHLFYCYVEKDRWFMYNLLYKAWREVNKDTIDAAVTNYLQSQNNLIDKGNKEKIENERKKALNKNDKSFDEKKVKIDQRYLITAGTVHNVIKNLKSFGMCGLYSFKEPFWFTEKQEGDKPNGLGWLNVKNGIINVDEIGRAFAENKPIPDGAFRQHSPAFFSLCQQLPVKFNPDAKCPKFDKHLSEVLPDVQARKHLQMMCGYFLMVGDHRFNVAFILYGQGGTGKTTTARVFKHLFGEENVIGVKYKVFGERFQTEPMLNKILNIDEDMAKQDTKDASDDREGELKKITSGDLVTIERKGVQPFSSTISAHLLFCTNNMPYISDKTGAFFDRIRIIPFNQRFRETQREININELEKTLTTESELEGELIWALKGWGMLRGLTSFPELEASKDIKAAIQELQCPVMAYLKENLTYDVNGFIPTAETYEAYGKWANENHHRPVSISQFCEAIRDQFPNAKPKQRNDGGKRQRGYIGLVLIKPITLQPKPQADESDIDF